MPQKIIKVKTPKHSLTINCFYNFISIKKVRTKKELFLNMCKEGCRNYNKKYCCPPLSPNFNSYVKGYNQLFILFFSLGLKQLDNFGYYDYHKVRIGNAVIKPRIEKIMRYLEIKFNSKFLSTGACRLCKPCQLKVKKSCKHPDKRRYSLESLGVYCDILSKKLFNKPLLWYENRKAPEYTSVICALLIKKSADKKLIVKETENQLNILK